MFNRKRKRHTGKPTASSPQPEDQYQLTDPPLQPPKLEQPLEDDKVINYLGKMHPRQTISKPDQFTYITIIMSNSEARHFQDLPDFVKSLRENFAINDISISQIIPGSIDRYITIYGIEESIAKAVLYISFILNAKLNNIASLDLFTFKSTNYKITLLLKHVDKLQNSYGLKYIDKSQQFTYNFTKDLHSVFVQGDLHSLFNTLLQCCELDLNVDSNDTPINDVPLFGIHVDSALYTRSTENAQLLAKSNNNLFEFLKLNV